MENRWTSGTTAGFEDSSTAVSKACKASHSGSVSQGVGEWRWIFSGALDIPRSLLSVMNASRFRGRDRRPDLLLYPSQPPSPHSVSLNERARAETDVISRVLGLCRRRRRGLSMSRVIWQIGPQIAAKTAPPTRQRVRRSSRHSHEHISPPKSAPLLE